MEKNLWLEVASKCLEKAIEILNYKNGVIGEDADAAKTLIEAALAIDRADHEWKDIEFAGDPSDRMLFGLENWPPNDAKHHRRPWCYSEFL